MFADDLLASRDALSEMICLLDSDRDICLVASSRNIIDAQSVVLRVKSSFDKDLIAPGTSIIHKCLYHSRNLIGEPTTVMFRKDHARRGFNEGYEHLLDMGIWFHLLEKGKFAYINRHLCSFWVHPAQKRADNVRKRVYLDDYYPLLRQYLDRPYVRVGWVLKNYLVVDALYQFWKLNKKGLLERREASASIKSRFLLFFFVYPFFKLAKPFMKIYVSLLRTVAV